MHLLTRWPLRVTVPALLVLLTVAVSFVALRHYTRLADRAVEEQAIADLTGRATRTQSTIEYLLRHHAAERAMEEVASLAGDPNIQGVFLVDDHGTIIGSTNRAVVGAAAADVMPQATPADFSARSVAATRATERLVGAVYFTADRTRVEVVYPVNLGTIMPGEPRPSRTGLLFIHYSLAEPKAKARRAVAGQAVYPSLFVVSAAGLLWLLFHVTLTRRIDRLIAATGRLAAGDPTARSRLPGRDEVAAVAEAFDRMADHLALSRSSLQESRRFLSSLMGNLPGMVYRCRNDANWTMEFVSDGCLRVTGYPASDLLGNGAVSFGNLVHPDDQGWLWEKCQRSLNARVPCSNEYRIITATGHITWIWDQAHGVYSDAGDLVAVEGFITDISERKRTEEALRRAKEFSEHLIQTANVMILSLDRDGHIDIFNRTAEKITGYTLAEVTGKNWFEILTPKDRYPAVWEEFHRLMAGGIPTTFENPILTKSGEERHIMWQNNQVTADGQVVATISFGNDITKRKRAEEALHESQRTFATLIHNLPGAVYRCRNDQDWTTVFISEGILPLTGYTPSDFIEGKVAFGQLIHPDDQESVWNDIQAALQQKRSYQLVYRVHTASGTEKWLWEQGQGIFAPSGELLFLEGFVTDMSERKHAEEALRVSNSLLQATLDSTTDGILVVNRVGKIVGLNEQFTTMWKIPDHILSSRNDDQALAWVVDQLQQPDQFLQKVRELYAHPDAESSDVLEFKDGRTFERFSKPQLLEGQPVGRVWSFRDVTQRKQAEQALQEAEARLRLALEAGHIGTWDWNLVTGKIVWSHGHEALWGMAPGTFTGTYEAFDARIHPDDRDGMSRAIAEAIADRRTYLREFRVVWPDGSVHWIAGRGEPFFDDTGTPLRMIGTVRDVTERKLMDEILQDLNLELERRVQDRTAQLARSTEALERSNLELTRFAYVASHDLQSPLRSISGFAQLLQQTYRDQLGEEADTWINRVVDNAKRMQALIHDLLAYSRMDFTARPLAHTDLHKVFNNAVEGLDGAIRDAGAEVSCGTLPTVMGDRSQLVQLLQNLIDNGIKYHGPDPPRVHVAAEQHGAEWVVSVRDNGIGIDPHHQERIFEIFQRLHTQTAYPGTGIGLAICRRVATRHGGRIWVESQPGRGSVFFFTITTDQEVAS